MKNRKELIQISIQKRQAQQILQPATIARLLVKAVAPALNTTTSPEVKANVPDMVAVFARVMR